MIQGWKYDLVENSHLNNSVDHIHHVDETQVFYYHAVTMYVQAKYSKLLKFT